MDNPEATPMSDQTQDREAVRAAADYLIERFGAFDRDAYFACFAPEATFMFHTTDRLLGSCAEYQDEWSAWIDSGFSVLACTSHDQRIDFPTDDVAVFTHRVLTTVRDASGDQDLVERESIVFRREPNGTWLGVHEHLSPHP
jgi:ketosteroid isomerase-like protein